jgi:hypothetical protein
VRGRRRHRAHRALSERPRTSRAHSGAWPASGSSCARRYSSSSRRARSRDGDDRASPKAAGDVWPRASSTRWRRGRAKDRRNGRRREERDERERQADDEQRDRRPLPDAVAERVSVACVADRRGHRLRPHLAADHRARLPSLGRRVAADARRAERRERDLRLEADRRCGDRAKHGAIVGAERDRVVVPEWLLRERRLILATRVPTPKQGGPCGCTVWCNSTERTSRASHLSLTGAGATSRRDLPSNLACGRVEEICAMRPKCTVPSFLLRHSSTEPEEILRVRSVLSSLGPLVFKPMRKPNAHAVHRYTRGSLP